MHGLNHIIIILNKTANKNLHIFIRKNPIRLKNGGTNEVQNKVNHVN